MAVADVNPGKSEGIDLTLFRGTYVISTHSIPEPEPGPQPSGCGVTVPPLPPTHPSGGDYTATVISSAGTKWAANSQVSWIQITGEDHSPTGAVHYHVDDNPGGPRDGTITICRQKFTLHQV